jgi:hypothetical protein
MTSLAKIKTYGFEGTMLTNQLTNESPKTAENIMEIWIWKKAEFA